MNISDAVKKSEQIDHFFNCCEYSNFSMCAMKHYKKRQLLVRRFEKVSKLILIVSGRLNVYNEFSNGRNYILENIGEGAIIGEMETVSGGDCYISTVEAMTDCTTIIFDAQIYRHWFNEYPRFTRKAARRLACMLCDISMDRGENIVHSADFAVALELVRLYNESRENQGSRVITDTRNIISEKTGVSLRSVNRAISGFKQKEMITIIKGKIQINEDNYRKLTEFIG